MTSRRSMLPLILIALFSLKPPAAAEASPPSNLRSDILYTHRGEFVQVSPMRPLTLNAHVDQFQYDPLGIEIALTGSEAQGDQTVHFVKTIDARTGHELSRLTLTASTSDEGAGFSLLGWSASGKYLLLERALYDPQDPEAASNEYLRWDLSASPPLSTVIAPENALLPDMKPDVGSVNEYRSPDGRWIVFAQEYHALNAAEKPGRTRNAYLLYDPEKDTFRPLALPLDVSAYSWADKTHLKFWQGLDRKQIDVVSGQISPAPVSESREEASTDFSKSYPDLSLDTQSPDLHDSKGSDGHVSSYVIWIRRTPFGKIPLGAAAAGLMPNPDTAENPGHDDPRAAWSPNGRQVAFLANRDLCVTDLTAAADLLPREKMAVGLKLSCAEEQALAVSDLKQIGLGLIQYIQDDDEKFPAAKGIIKTVGPYLKTTDVFQIGSTQFVYEQPGATLASIDSPANTEMGYMDLPCARVVLFADGHVKSFPKVMTP